MTTGSARRGRRGSGAGYRPHPPRWMTLDDDALEVIRARHRPHTYLNGGVYEACPMDRQPWPCDASQLLGQIETGAAFLNHRYHRSQMAFGTL